LESLKFTAWLTPGRAFWYIRTLAVVNIISFILACCHAHGIFFHKELHLSTEFMGFFAAGRLMDAGTSNLIYAPGISLQAYIHSSAVAPAHLAIQRTIAADPQLITFTFFYPPVYWLICGPLAYLSFYKAFILWTVMTASLSTYCLWRALGHFNWIWPVAAYLPVFENLAVGENSFLLFGLLGMGWLNLNSRPFISGLWLGGLCFKPHFAIPAGVLLLSGLRWRALTGMACSSLLLCGLSVYIFGFNPWIVYFSVVVPHAEWMIQHGYFAFNIQATPFSAIRMLYGSVNLANIIQDIFSLIVLAILILFSRFSSTNVQFAALSASLPLAVSVMFNYDMTICGLAILCLYVEAKQTKFLPWEKSAMAGMLILPLISWVLRRKFNIPIDNLFEIAFLCALCGRLNLPRSNLYYFWRRLKHRFLIRPDGDQERFIIPRNATR
jgi:hypothetical protein